MGARRHAFVCTKVVHPLIAHSIPSVSRLAANREPGIAHLVKGSHAYAA